MTRFWKWNWKDISVIFRVKWTTGGIIDHRGVIHLIMQLTEVMERYQTNHRAIRWHGGLPHKAHRWIFLIQIGDLPCHQGTSSIVLGITIIKTTSLRHIIECLVLTSTISELPIQITSPFLHQIQVEIGVGGVGENLIKHFRYLVFKMQIFIFIFCKLCCMTSLKILFYKHINYGRYLYSNNISKNIVES